MMDINVALEDFRRYLEDLGAAIETEDQYATEDALTGVQESFNALDGWLSRKGALPEAWSR